MIGGLVVLGGIIGAIAGGGDDEGDSETDNAESTETTTAVTTSAPGATGPPAAPETQGDADEIDDVTLTECVNQPGVGWAVARGTIANDSSDTSTYFIELNVVDPAGTVVGNALTSVANVLGDGGSATWEAPSTVELPAGGQCIITSVERVAS